MHLEYRKYPINALALTWHLRERGWTVVRLGDFGWEVGGWGPDCGIAIQPYWDDIAHACEVRFSSDWGEMVEEMHGAVRRAVGMFLEGDEESHLRGVRGWLIQGMTMEHTLSEESTKNPGVSGRHSRIP